MTLFVWRPTLQAKEAPPRYVDARVFRVIDDSGKVHATFGMTEMGGMNLSTWRFSIIRMWQNRRFLQRKKRGFTPLHTLDSTARMKLCCRWIRRGRSQQSTWIHPEKPRRVFRNTWGFASILTATKESLESRYAISRVKNCRWAE